MPLSFKSPWMLVGLLLLAGVIALWWWADRRRSRYAVRYTNVDVLASVVSGRSWGRWIPAALIGLGLAALLVAMARPEVDRMLLTERATVILVVDTSRSMQAEDVAPTRLGAAQEALRTFLDQAPDDLRVGLVVFAGEAQVATPPTKDHKLVEAAITDIDEFLVYGGTAIGDALQTAVLLGRSVTDLVPEEEGQTAAPSLTRSLAQATDPDEQADEEKSPVSILFLSDGAQTRGLLQPLEGANLAKDAGFPVYTVALGTPEGVIERGPFGGPPGQGGRASSSLYLPIRRRSARSRRRQEASSRRRAPPTRSRRRTPTSVRSSGASRARARSPGSSSRSPPFSSCSEPRPRRSSRRAFPDQAAMTTNGPSASSARPAFCTRTRKVPAPRVSTDAENSPIPFATMLGAAFPTKRIS